MRSVRGRGHSGRRFRDVEAPGPLTPEGLGQLLLRVAGAVLVTLACAACNRGVRTHVEEPFPQKLSEWRLFVGKPASLQPNRGVVPYDVSTPLFSDYASKHRFVWMPPGTSAVYNETESFDFPVGTIFSKTFAFPVDRGAGNPRRERLIETRLLVHTRSGWVGLPYVWNKEETEAVLEVAADPTVVEWTHPSGAHYTINYTIPNTNQCKECHNRSKAMVPLGPKARNLNKDYPYADGPANQLAYWTRIGYLRGAPSPDQAPKAAVWDDPMSGSLDARARAYLDVNCGTCHNPSGSASNTGLYLTIGETDPLRLGVCKVPVSAGQGSGDLRFGIVPGSPNASILVHRMASTAPKVMMPEIGRTVAHEEGVALIAQWVTEMPAMSRCEAPRRAVGSGSGR
jgi:uncharacterized repeat protein (TIGR03806 family)